MSRLTRLGKRLAACDPPRQIAEMRLCCAILDPFSRPGMPDTAAIA